MHPEHGGPVQVHLSGPGLDGCGAHAHEAAGSAAPGASHLGRSASHTQSLTGSCWKFFKSSLTTPSTHGPSLGWASKGRLA